MAKQKSSFGLQFGADTLEISEDSKGYLMALDEGFKFLMTKDNRVEIHDNPQTADCTFDLLLVAFLAFKVNRHQLHFIFYFFLYLS